MQQKCWFLGAALLLTALLSGCAVSIVPQQDLTPYFAQPEVEEYTVAFKVTYPETLPQRDSLATIEQKLLNSPGTAAPYIIEIYHQTYISTEQLTLRVWSAGDAIHQEVITGRLTGSSSGRPAAVAEARDEFFTLAAAHFAQQINEQARADYPSYAAVISENSQTALREYLSGNRQSLFYHAALRDLGKMAPAGAEEKAWHSANKARYPGYTVAQEGDLKLWLTGPEGFSFWELKEAMQQGKTPNELLPQALEARAFDLPTVTYNERYGTFDFEEYMRRATYTPVLNQFAWNDNLDNQTNWQNYIHANLSNQYRFEHQFSGIGVSLSERQKQTLRQQGITDHLIAAANLNDDRYGEPFAQWRHERLSPEQYIHSIRIDNNTGHYLSPYTEDDVVSEWVNRAINARIGATIGSTAGAVVGAELGRNLPVPGGQFIGGMLGSAAGQSTGRNAAIQTVGGWDFIREHSDYSFANLRDMAEYLVYHFSDRDDFMDVISAASAVYPGLNREVNAIVL